MKKKFLVGIIFAAFAFLPMTSHALVADDINSANPGETVIVDGENQENITINKSIVLKGEEDDIIDGSIIISGDNVNVTLEGFTVKGSIRINAQNSSVQLQNITLDGENDLVDNILVDIRAVGTDVSIDNTTFKGFLKAGIYAEAFKNFTVANSNFDGIGTANIGSLEDYVASNPDVYRILRSAACIDLNLGNNAAFTLGNIMIVGNTFVGIQNTAGEDSTAGAVKIKLKKPENVTLNNSSATLLNNTFKENADDVVIGTESNIMSSSLPVVFYLNTSTENETGVRVTNNGAQTAEKSVIDSDMIAYRKFSTDSTDENVNFYVITIDHTQFLVQEGATLKDATESDTEKPINLDDFKVKEGYKFLYFVEKGTGNVIDEDTAITKNMTLEAVFESLATGEVENPETNDNFLIIGSLSVVSLALAILTAKKLHAKSY